MSKGRYRKALEANRKAIELNPNHEPAVSNIGFANLILGRFDEALPWMKKSLVLEPTGSQHQPSKVGLVYVFLADDVKADQWFRRALEVQRDLDEVHIGLSWLYLAQGKYEQSLDESRKILPFSFIYPEGLHVAGTAELLLGDYSQAKQIHGRLIAIQSTGRGWVPPTNYLTTAGYVFWKTGRQNDAREMFSQSLEIDKKDLQEGNESHVIRYDLAALNAIQGNKAEAYNWLQKAIDAGFRNYRFGLIDPLLENLRQEERFKQMMGRISTDVEDMRKRATSN